MKDLLRQNIYIVVRVIWHGLSRVNVILTFKQEKIYAYFVPTYVYVHDSYSTPLYFFFVNPFIIQL